MRLHRIAAASLIGLVVTAMPACNSRAQPLMTVLRGDDATGPNRIENSGFEDQQDGRPRPWTDWREGFRAAPGEGRDGSAAVTCVFERDGEQYGASQTVTLDQTAAIPIIVRAWSKAQDVSGLADREYALYCDLEYTDGTPLWGQVSPFAAGSHDWQQREVMIIAAKPVRSITVHCLFRGHRGQVWFDDVELFELRAAEGTAILDGVAVVPGTPPPPAEPAEKTGGGVSLRYGSGNGAVSTVKVGGEEVSAAEAVGGFMVRDAAADSDFHGFRDGKCEDLGLELDVDWTESADAIRLSGTLRDTTGEDRAVTLLFALPVAARGAEWGGNIRAGRPIGETGESTDSVAMGTGATGTMARYPFSCVCADDWGLGLGLDLDRPCQYRLVYNADTRQHYAAFDFGLVPDTTQFPSSAPFGLVIYSVDPQWGFRSAAQRYYDLFPESFACVSKQQGIWMPFSKISEVEGWEDFGFRYKEGNNETAWDDGHDILTFRYTEPSTWWMSMPKAMPRTYDAAMAEAKRIAEEGTGGRQLKAEALLTSGLFDEQGRYIMQFRDTPWCDGAVFSMSCLPHIKGDVIDARIGWNEQVEERLYGPGREADLDGEYLDSLEGYVTSDTDFRRDHFAVVRRPLTFTRVDPRPVIHKALAVDEFVQWIAGDVHGLGKLMMANAVPHRFTFLCRHLDVMGTETNWVRGNDWAPMSHEELGMIRTMCAQKPYLFLMNTDFDALAPYVERYFQRSLFYGMYPSMFSPVASSQDAYWTEPRWYNRDRELHRKYQPIIRRVGEAGWQPLTLARTDTPDILLERFGPSEADGIFITLFNDGDEERAAEVRLDASLMDRADVQARELVSGESVKITAQPNGSAQFALHLQPDECKVVALRP